MVIHIFAYSSRLLFALESRKIQTKQTSIAGPITRSFSDAIIRRACAPSAHLQSPKSSGTDTISIPSDLFSARAHDQKWKPQTTESAADRQVDGLPKAEKDVLPVSQPLESIDGSSDTCLSSSSTKGEFDRSLPRSTNNFLRHQPTSTVALHAAQDELGIRLWRRPSDKQLVYLACCVQGCSQWWGFQSLEHLQQHLENRSVHKVNIKLTSDGETIDICSALPAEVNRVAAKITLVERKQELDVVEPDMKPTKGGGKGATLDIIKVVGCDRREIVDWWCEVS